MTPELARRLTEVGACAGWQWTAERERAVWEDVLRSRARTRVAGAGAAVAVAVAVMLVGWFGFRWDAGRATAGAEGVDAGLLMRLEDGSTVTAVHEGARLEPVKVATDLVVLRLHSGAARFSVTPGLKRSFRVLAGPYAVHVVGTVFTVALEPKSVVVQVERGTVLVPLPNGDQRVSGGHGVSLPIAEPSPAPTPAVVRTDEPAEPVPDEPAAAPAPQARAHPAVQQPPSPSTLSWRDLAHRGDYAKAYERLQAEGQQAVRDDAGDLLLVADVARLSGHPSAAESALRRVLRNHGGDARAPLAAFTLGRVLLDDYGRPEDAARAFSRARQLAPGGVLAEDALAREVECRARAGQSELARSLAEQYLKAYPNGQRAKTVRRHGGL